MSPDSDADSTSALEATICHKLFPTHTPSPVTRPPPTTRRKPSKKPSKSSTPSIQPSYTANTSAIESRLLTKSLLPHRSPSSTRHQTRTHHVPVSHHTAHPTNRPHPHPDRPTLPHTVSQGKQKRLDAAEYVDLHRREVNRLGSTALNKRDRRVFELTERTRLGCRPPKRQKMPIALLLHKRKKQRQRDERQRELDLASGMLVRSRRRR